MVSVGHRGKQTLTPVVTARGAALDTGAVSGPDPVSVSHAESDPAPTAGAEAGCFPVLTSD